LVFDVVIFVVLTFSRLDQLFWVLHGGESWFLKNCCWEKSQFLFFNFVCYVLFFQVQFLVFACISFFFVLNMIQQNLYFNSSFCSSIYELLPYLGFVSFYQKYWWGTVKNFMRMLIYFFFMKMSLHKLTSKYSTGKRCNSWNLKRFLPRINLQRNESLVFRRVFAFVVQRSAILDLQTEHHSQQSSWYFSAFWFFFFFFFFFLTILDLFKFSVLRCCSRESLCLKQFAIAHTLKCGSLNTDYRSVSTISQSFNEMSRVIE
jgi:hypothetical protein